ncbi:peptidoglycan-binding protein [Streptomyces sp. NPDC006512]|uniref:peptidoglycan-binding protein n=1 Tax=Streptomyces sp. NPDC006512 TaxID=3154307 RepID=UPI00339F89F9
MSSPICPRCGDHFRCDCAATQHTSAAGRPAAPAQFEQEWVRPYLALHEAVPGEAPPAATAAWVVPRVVRASDLPPDTEVLGPPVAVTGAGRRARRSAKERRHLPLTAAVATLIGCAAIAGTYAFSRERDTREMTSPPPASRLDVLDVDDGSGAAAEPSQPRGPLPGGAQRTAPAGGQGPAGTSAPAGRPAPPSAPAIPGVGSASADGRLPDGQSSTPSAPGPVPTAAGPTLRRHDAGPEVAELQNRLAQIGAWSLPQRGRYDRHLQNAVEDFQAAHRVQGDPPGVYGPATRRLLESMTS